MQIEKYNDWNNCGGVDHHHNSQFLICHDLDIKIDEGLFDEDSVVFVFFSDPNDQ